MTLLACDKRADAETLTTGSALPQVYLILDEFILGGEIQESSKKVILERLAGEGSYLLAASVFLRLHC